MPTPEQIKKVLDFKKKGEEMQKESVAHMKSLSEKVSSMSQNLSDFGKSHEALASTMAGFIEVLKQVFDTKYHLKTIDGLNAISKGIAELHAKESSFTLDTSPIAEMMGSLKEHMKGMSNVGEITVSGGSGENFLPYASSLKTTANVTVSSSGTAVPLASTATMCRQVTITALDSNTGTIFYGDSAVSASGKKGTPLNPFAVATISINDISKIYVDSTQSGDGVSVSYLS